MINGTNWVLQVISQGAKTFVTKKGVHTILYAQWSQHNNVYQYNKPWKHTTNVATLHLFIT
jgi:hypothetical protein